MKHLQSLFMLGAAAAFVISCSSKPSKVDIPANANPSDEITSFENDLHQAEANQVSVLSPKNYEKAKDYLSDAKELREKNKSGQDILEKVGYGRAYLNLANENVKKANEQMPEVLRSRQDAMTSGAETILASEFKAADNDMRAQMEGFEKNPSRVDSKDKDKLNKKYLDLELKAIKASYLSQARNNLDLAEKNGAKRAAPKTYASAKDKIQAAERTIETDRHDTEAIGAASAAALTETQKLLTINGIIKNAKKETPEDLALQMNANRKALDTVSSDVATKEEALKNQQAHIQHLTNSNEALSESNSELRGKVSEDQALNQRYEEARKHFSPQEADIYRQGSNLLIRLKGLDFKSGHADLSKKSFGTLNKVKDVIAEMGADKVVVEGHTDSVGSKAINEKLSKERADTVANYFVSTGVVDKGSVETEGYGFEKPISSNKTKEGRAQNRRVDVIISPSAVE